MEQFNQLNTKLEQIWAVGKTLEGNQGTVLESLTSSAQELLKQVETIYNATTLTKAQPDEYCAGAMPDPSCFSFQNSGKTDSLVLHEMDVYELINRPEYQGIRMADGYIIRDFTWQVDTFEYGPDRLYLTRQCREALSEIIGISMRAGVNKGGIRKRAMELWASLMLAPTVVDVENRKNEYFEFIRQVKTAIEARFVDAVDGILLFEQKLAH